MNKLISLIKSLENSNINNQAEKRLKEFTSFKSKNKDLWYEELCFCILAANAKGRNAFNIQLDLGAKGLLNNTKKQLVNTILKHKHRFHNNKAKYIIESRKYRNIKVLVTRMIKEKGIISTRDWLVENIKGIGMKEASHFLRNTGTFNIAILDRHVMNLMIKHRIIKRPITLTKNKYLEIEKKFLSLSKKLNINPAKLDLFLWYSKTGEVMK